MDAVQLNLLFRTLYYMKVRRKEGKEYPSKTLYNISCGILRYFCAREIQDMNFLDRVDPRFPGFRKNLETINA